MEAFAECFRRNRSLQHIRMYIPKEFQPDLLHSIRSNSFLLDGEIGGLQANNELNQITNRNYLRRSAPRTLDMLVRANGVMHSSYCPTREMLIPVQESLFNCSKLG